MADILTLRRSPANNTPTKAWATIYSGRALHHSLFYVYGAHTQTHWRFVVVGKRRMRR